MHMNSETRLTLDQLNTICLRHNIRLATHSRLTAGFSHEVHRINRDLVLKLFDPANSGSYKTELALLSSELPFKKPGLIAYGERDAEIDRNYVIMTYVPGVSLGTVWHLATEPQRSNLIKEICASLKAITRIDPAILPEAAVDSWEDLLTDRFQNLLVTLQNKKIIDQNIIDKAQAYFYRNAGVLKGTTLYPFYWDIQFDNFIVNDRFELQAIIDLESLGLTSLDYPVCIIQNQMAEPHKFLREEDEKYAAREDYAHLMQYYRQYYPEMFDFSDLKTRIRLYQLLDTLHLLVDWSHVKDNYLKLDSLIS